MANEPVSTGQKMLKALHLLPGGALLFALIPLVVFGYLGWYYYAADKIDRTFYSLKQDQIEISTQPTWIKSSVLEQVYRDKRLDRVNLLDPAANAYIASAFETCGWVKSTSRVRKLGHQVVVDLVYRQPVAMLKVTYQDPESSRWIDGFYALDSQGYVLPRDDFSEEQVYDYLLIEIDNIGTQSHGMAYADSRVHEALKLATLLETSGARQSLAMQWLKVLRDGDATVGKPWTLQLWTADKRMIHWGHAPGEEIPGEPTADDKLAALTNWLTTERTQGTQGSQIDLSRPHSPGQTAHHRQPIP